MQQNSSEHESGRLEIHPLQNQYCRYFVTWRLIQQIYLLSSWFTGPEFLTSNNQNDDLKDLKD